MTTILIAEDDTDIRSIINDLLRDSGYKVVLASDGKEVLSLIKKQKPDLLVLDLAMPEIDGWEVAKTLRLSAATKTLPIIALTAHAMPSDRKRALAAGCSSYLPKPFLIEDLLAEIQRLLERPSSKN